MIGETFREGTYPSLVGCDGRVFFLYPPCIAPYHLNCSLSVAKW